jgi:hypothetical protein
MGDGKPRHLFIHAAGEPELASKSARNRSEIVTKQKGVTLALGRLPTPE